MKKQLILIYCLIFLSNIISAQADTEKSALEKANTAKENKDYAMALNWFKKANTLNPKNSTTYYNITSCYNELGQYDEAVKTAEDGIRLTPEIKLYNESGFALTKLYKYKDAIEKYKKALALNAQNEDAIKGIASAYFSNKEYTSAEIYYKKCLDTGIDLKQANYRLGYIMNETKDYKKAIQYELAAIRLDENYAQAYNELGYAYSQSKQKSTALENYQKAYDINPQNATYATNIADLYYSVPDLKDLVKAEEYYKKSLDINNSNAVSNFRLGWILNEKEKYDEAKTYLNKAVELKPTYADAWIELGWNDFSQKNYYDAESDYLKAIQYNPKTETGRYYLGQVYIKQGKTSNAQKMVDELRSIDSKYADKLKVKM